MGLFGLGKAKERTFTEYEGQICGFEGKRLVSIEFKGDGDYETPVVGLNYRQDEVDAVAEALAGKGSGRHQVTAQLLREPSNPHDRNAIRVVVEGYSVGYVPRENSEVIAPALDRGGFGLYLTCPALVVTDSFAEIRYIRLDIAFDAEAKQRREAAARQLEAAGKAAMSAIDSGSVTDIWTADPKPRGEVEGESEFVGSINSILCKSLGIKSIPGSGTEAEIEAFLVPSGRTVVVMAEGAVLGRLETTLADDAHNVLAALEKRGRYARVRARLWSNGGVASVNVDVPGRDLGAPVNEPPSAPFAVLPSGRMVQVTGEEAYLEQLSRLLGGTSQRAVWVTIHQVEPRPGKPAAEVRIDGEPVGMLSAATGKEVLPLVAHLSAAGKTAAAPGFVKGSALKADVSFRCGKASEVPAGWLQAHGD